jgi:hypothetical protein
LATRSDPLAAIVIEGHAAGAALDAVLRVEARFGGVADEDRPRVSPFM